MDNPNCKVVVTSPLALGYNGWSFTMKSDTKVGKTLPSMQMGQQLLEWWDQTPAGRAVTSFSSKFYGHKETSKFVNRLEKQLYQHVPRHLKMSNDVAAQPLASVTARHAARPQPLMDTALARDEVKGRLAPLAVYTVANPKNEFVLVSGAQGQAPLGLFFFNKEDAHHLIRRVRDGSARLARDAKVLRVTLDNVFEVFTAPRESTGLQGIHFRFMPDMKQLKHAVQLYREAGLQTRSFVGVPVFQAEGLTVTAHEAQFVPLFLAREDLDVAAAAAHRQRNAAQIQDYGAKAAAAAEDLNQAQEELKTAEGELRRLQGSGAAAGAAPKSLELLRSHEARAREQLEAALLKAAAVEKAPPPKIEVGSLEEVIMRMSAPKASAAELAAWSQVMFVAPDLLRSSAAARDLEAPAAAAAGRVAEGPSAQGQAKPGIFDAIVNAFRGRFEASK